MREEIFTEEFYHVYNRGVDKRTIFQDKHDVARFLQSMREFNILEPIGSIRDQGKRERGGKPDRYPTPGRLVNIVAYCLNPNHYHFIVQPIVDDGLSEFMRRLGVGYTNYFNKKHDRSGALFQGRYKYKYIDSDDDLAYVSVYVNLNNLAHGYRDRSWIPVSSFSQYVGEAVQAPHYLVENKEMILAHFKGLADYREYANETLTEIILNKEEHKEIGL